MRKVYAVHGRNCRCYNTADLPKPRFLLVSKTSEGVNSWNMSKWRSPGHLDSSYCIESDLCMVVADACVLKAKCRAAVPCTLHGPWQSLGALSYPIFCRFQSKQANSDINRNETTWYMVIYDIWYMIYVRYDDISPIRTRSRMALT